MNCATLFRHGLFDPNYFVSEVVLPISKYEQRKDRLPYVKQVVKKDGLVLIKFKDLVCCAYEAYTSDCPQRDMAIFLSGIVLSGKFILVHVAGCYDTTLKQKDLRVYEAPTLTADELLSKGGPGYLKIPDCKSIKVTMLGTPIVDTTEIKALRMLFPEGIYLPEGPVEIEIE